MESEEQQVEYARDWLRDCGWEHQTEHCRKTLAGLLLIDRKARAWDALEKYGFDNDCLLMLAEMEKILSPPQPKDPLEELEEFIDNETWVAKTTAPGYVISIPVLLAEIRRLRVKK
jgi:hypothetical protein